VAGGVTGALCLTLLVLTGAAIVWGQDAHRHRGQRSWRASSVGGFGATWY
jgi:hypothetical protein